MKKFKFLKILGVLIVLFLIGFVCNIFYKYSILAKIYDKNVRYDIGNNYHITILDENKSESHIYYKDGIGKSQSQDDTYRLTMGNEMYAINEANKTYKILDTNFPSTPIISNVISLTTYGLTNVTEKSDLFYNIAPKASIKKDTYNGKECYIVSVNDETVWVDIDTFFIVKDEFRGQITEYKVEIGATTDDDVSKIDLKDYKIVE